MSAKAAYRAVDSKESTFSDFIRTASPDLFDKTRRFSEFVHDFQSRTFDRYQLPIKRYQGSHAIVDGGAQVGGKRGYCLLLCRLSTSVSGF